MTGFRLFMHDPHKDGRSNPQTPAIPRLRNRRQISNRISDRNIFPVFKCTTKLRFSIFENMYEAVDRSHFSVILLLDDQNKLYECRDQISMTVPVQLNSRDAHTATALPETASLRKGYTPALWPPRRAFLLANIPRTTRKIFPLFCFKALSWTAWL